MHKVLVGKSNNAWLISGIWIGLCESVSVWLSVEYRSVLALIWHFQSSWPSFRDWYICGTFIQREEAARWGGLVGKYMQQSSTVQINLDYSLNPVLDMEGQICPTYQNFWVTGQQEEGGVVCDPERQFKVKCLTKRKIFKNNQWCLHKVLRSSSQ